jgi:hypothetical protein
LHQGVRVERRHDPPAPKVLYSDDDIMHAQAVSGPRALGESLDIANNDVIRGEPREIVRANVGTIP